MVQFEPDHPKWASFYLLQVYLAILGQYWPSPETSVFVAHWLFHPLRRELCWGTEDECNPGWEDIAGCSVEHNVYLTSERHLICDCLRQEKTMYTSLRSKRFSTLPLAPITSPGVSPPSHCCVVYSLMLLARGIRAAFASAPAQRKIARVRHRAPLDMWRRHAGSARSRYGPVRVGPQGRHALGSACNREHPSNRTDASVWLSFGTHLRK